MQIWIDTTDKKTLEIANEMGLIYGVTTNPSILCASAFPPKVTIDFLLSIQSGPVAVQVTKSRQADMFAQAIKIANYNSRIIIKVPATADGWKVMADLKKKNIAVLATTILDAKQYYLSSLVGADYAAPYFESMHQVQSSYQNEINKMLQMYKQQNLATKIMAAQITKIDQILYCAESGVPAITLSAAIFQELIQCHPRVSDHLGKFTRDWNDRKDELFEIP